MPDLKNKSDIAIIILAAGGSRRMGQAKQLLPYQQENLLQRIVSSVLLVPHISPVVVIGASKDLMKEALLHCLVTIVENEHWEQGLATSITAGLSAALNMNPGLSGCLFVVCDQPHLKTSLLKDILATHIKTRKGIIAATYKGITGTPVFFSKKYFGEILQLTQEEGAKKILSKYPEDLETLSFAEGNIDIDTPGDYQSLINAQ